MIFWERGFLSNYKIIFQQTWFLIQSDVSLNPILITYWLYGIGSLVKIAKCVYILKVGKEYLSHEILKGFKDLEHYNCLVNFTYISSHSFMMQVYCGQITGKD